MNGTTVTVLMSLPKSHSISDIGTVTYVAVSCLLIVMFYVVSLCPALTVTSLLSFATH